MRYEIDLKSIEKYFVKDILNETGKVYKPYDPLEESYVDKEINSMLLIPNQVYSLASNVPKSLVYEDAKLVEIVVPINLAELKVYNIPFKELKEATYINFKYNAISPLSTKSPLKHIVDRINELIDASNETGGITDSLRKMYPKELETTVKGLNISNYVYTARIPGVYEIQLVGSTKGSLGIAIDYKNPNAKQIFLTKNNNIAKNIVLLNDEHIKLEDRQLNIESKVIIRLKANVTKGILESYASVEDYKKYIEDMSKRQEEIYTDVTDKYKEVETNTNTVKDIKEGLKDTLDREVERQKAEDVRKANEEERLKNEKDRQSQEETRNKNEDTRLSQEQTRQSQETERVEAEKRRKNTFDAWDITMQGVLPKASETSDGIITSSDYIKLRDITSITNEEIDNALI